MRKVLVLLLALSVAACGDDSGAPDASGSDATTSDVVAADAPADVEVFDASDAAISDEGVDATDAAPDASASGATCANPIVPAGSAVYTGTTCDGQNTTSLSCNTGAHQEVWFRVDGDAGQIWKVSGSPGLAMGLYDSFSQNKCGTTENVCLATYGADGGVIADAGVSVGDGPFPSARSDYFVFESENPSACGPYTITVTLQ